MKRPIRFCYWVEPGRLLAGEYPRTLDETSSQAKIDTLLEAGVTAFVDLTEADEGLLPYAGMVRTATHHRFPIPDVSVPASRDATREVLDTIDQLIERGEVVYVHCWGGVGRTGLIVGCWLARHGHPGQAALRRLRELWAQCPKSVSRRSPETLEQEQYVIEWTEDLTGGPGRPADKTCE